MSDSKLEKTSLKGSGHRRPRIAFFDYPDVFEDFYPHYGVTQSSFSSDWFNTANHAWLTIVQREIGDVTWYVTALRPEIKSATHRRVGCIIKFVRSSWLHRILWNFFYIPPFAWRWRRFYRTYALIASYLSPLSWQLWRSLKKDRPDVLFVQDYCSGRFDILSLFAWLLNLPLVAFHSGSTSDKYLGKFVKHFTIPSADFIFPSGLNEENHLALKFKFPRENQLIIRPPIDVSVYQPVSRSEACRAFGLNPDKHYFIFMGRLDDGVKRISNIIDVFVPLAAAFREFDLLIVGSGQDEQSLKHQANEVAPGRIHFLGWLGDDKSKVLALGTADCLLLASLREASPAVIGEAFACGVPVISTNVGGIDDLVIQDESGWLYPPQDYVGLGNCMKKVMNDPALIIPMRKKARAIAVECVSIESVTRNLKKGFKAVL
jgi:glycosyltransferase involved in cell wall biosynthesis